MARTARIKNADAGTSHYHLMSRANDRRFLFEKGRVKTQLGDALKRGAAFSGIQIDAYSAIDNHFHVVCKVVRPDEPVPEDELVRRVAALKGGRYRATCMRYVYFNPVRAGIVSRATDYALCWMAAPEAPFSGSVPEGWLMRRVAQIGGGKVFGSETFVVATAFALGDRFRSRHVLARAVVVVGWATRRMAGSLRRRLRHELGAQNIVKSVFFGGPRGAAPAMRRALVFLLPTNDCRPALR